jgi:hypothetical protein
LSTRMDSMHLGLVVTTLGRLEPLRALLTSLDGQLTLGDQVVLVAQGRHKEVKTLADEYAVRGMPVIATASERGASLGRNTGVAALPPGDFVVNFPNDTTVFPAQSVEKIRAAVSEGEFLAGGLATWDERGPKTDMPAAGTRLDRWNVWTVVEMGLLLRRSLFEELGGFDETIGPGSPTPWQVAEGTDLLLRALSLRPEVAERFCWLPEVHVDGISTGFGLTAQERRRKMRAYGRGTGHAMTVHRYPLWWRIAFTLAGLLYGFRNARPITVRDGWPMFLGRLEGGIGRTLGQRQMVSATR